MICKEASAESVADSGRTINTAGAPGVTVTISVLQMIPKHAETVCWPDVYGVKTPV